jgi:hypothetical protein
MFPATAEFLQKEQACSIAMWGVTKPKPKPKHGPVSHNLPNPLNDTGLAGLFTMDPSSTDKLPEAMMGDLEEDKDCTVAIEEHIAETQRHAK